MTQARIDVLIATPLEADLVERITTAVPHVHILFDPQLLPPPRYPSDHRGVAGFERDPAGEQRWQSWLEQAEVLFGVPGETPQGLAETVRRHPGIRWIQGTAAGAGQLLRRAELSADELARVKVTSASGVHASQLAEWAIFGLLALTKDLPRLLADKAAHRWDHYPVRELRDQHLVVVGLGEIGRQIARYARALGMRVTGVRRNSGDAADADVDELRPVDDLPKLFARCDAVALALPGTAATERMIDRELIEALPSHAVVVNVGRGTVIEEAALVEALESGRLAGAALDVYETEPLAPASRLWDLSNVLISPHTAALSTRENERLTELFVDNLRRYVAREPLRNLVDTAEFY